MNLSAVILAGGESRRMGRDKAWLEIEGKPLLARGVALARELGATEVFISGRVGEDYSAFGCSVLLDLQAGLGPLGGIERGLHAATSPLLLVLAVDLPRMTTALLQKLRNHCDRLTGVVPWRNGDLEPLAAIYPKRCHALAFEAFAKSRLAVRDFVAACWRERAVRLLPVSAAEANCFANWNCPDDLPRGWASLKPGTRPNREHPTCVPLGQKLTVSCA